MSAPAGSVAGVGFYERQILPRVIGCACGTKSLQRWRRAALASAGGTTVEIGFGSGTNVPLYPVTIERVLAVEPSEVARRMAAARIAASPIPVEVIGLDGQSLPLADRSCDSAISTFTLCTVPDPSAALSELHRVLNEHGTLHLLEHGRAPEERVAAQQRRFDGIQARVFGGCHLTRDVPALVEQAGFVRRSFEQRYLKGAPRAISFVTIATYAKA